MSKDMKIFLIIICLSITVFFVYNKVSDKIRINKIESHILKEFGSLNDLKIEDIENTSVKQLKEQCQVYYNLRNFLRDNDTSMEKIKIAETLLSKFYKIQNEWYKESEEIIRKYDGEKFTMLHKSRRKYYEKKSYELYLRKMKGITDENIIKDRLEKQYKTKVLIDSIPEEYYDKELAKKFFKLCEKELDEISDQGWKKAKEELNEEELEKTIKQEWKKAKEERKK